MISKQAFSRISLILILLIIPFISYGQSNSDLVKQVQKLLEENYIFLDKAEAINKHLDDLIVKEVFENKTLTELANVLTQEMHSVVNDKHLMASPPRQQQQVEVSEPEISDNLSRYRAPILRGFNILENNIGYVDLGYFGGSPEYFSKIDLIMQELIIADAIIVDMRKSLGGSPKGVQYLCSYFFEKDLLLNTIYSRFNDQTLNLRTIEVKGKKRPNVPVYILTSSNTFSAAEDFPYTMQSLKRAKIIGEITRGGAHPTRYFPVANGFGMSIPVARSINPITKTNWEGIGVIPDLKIDADYALEKAIELAKIKAIEYKNSLFVELKTAFSSLENSKSDIKETQDSIFKILKQLHEIKIVNEFEINAMGYSYLQADKANVALSIFKSNTLIFTNSANTYDSYAEALGVVNQNELAIKNYRKAIAVATEEKDENLIFYKKNLEVFQESINEE